MARLQRNRLLFGASASANAPPAPDLGDPFDLGPVAIGIGVNSLDLTTNTALVPGPTGAGIWCAVSLFGTNDTLNVNGITDNSGNSYAYSIQAVQGSAAGNRKVYTVWVDAPNGLASGTVLTAAFSGTTGRRLLRVVGFTGKPALEAHAGTGGVSTGPITINVPTPGTVANVGALELLATICGDAANSGGTVDSDFTIIGSDSSTGGTGSTSGKMRLRWRRATTNAQVNFSETITAAAEWAVAYDILYGV